ncbi:MAG: GTP-binding signal recognition particle [Parcubacteria group bacterium LiPW_39]|nr:MAG: GTP-binding signal recognition particle [Parcubacteria group bacterium LiPW_39]
MAELLYKELSYKLQGIFIDVRKNFGPGHKEIIYRNALMEEFGINKISFEKEKNINIFSPKTGNVVGNFRVDFLIDNKIILEVKAVDLIPKNFIDQIYSYLKNSEYELGYFVNFRSPRLYVKRIIYTNDRKPFLKLV